MKNKLNRPSHFVSVILFFSCFLLSSNLSFAQKKQLDVRAIETSNYPEVKGKLWVRDPEGIKTDEVQFYEDDRPVKVNFESFQKVDSVAQNKAILILIRNTANTAEMKWYKDVLTAAFKNGTIKKGDKIEIVGFSCLIEKQILFPSKFNFTDNEQDLLARIDKIKEYKRKENQGRVQTHIAINEALNLLDAQKLSIPTGIFILSDDRMMDPDLVGELPGDRSKRLNIPIYGVTFYKNNNEYSIEDLCSQVYGSYITEVKNDVKIVSKELSSFFKDFNQRHAGLYYPFEYTSSFEKDGKNHLVKIDSKDGPSGFSLPVPSKNVFELIQDNPIVSLLVFILLLGLIVVIIFLFKKNKLKKEELEMQRKKDFEAMEQNQRSSDQKLTQQEMELQRIKEDEQRDKEQILREKQSEVQKREDDEQFQKMLERGNLPWFEFRFGNETGSYQIQTPRLTVGRDASNVWTINHPTVSRNHFQLYFKNYVYTLRDLGSSNGIIVNDMKVTEIELKHGDCIQVGEITMTFHI